MIFICFVIYLIWWYLVASLRLNDSDDGLHTSSFRWNSSRKQTGPFNQYKSKDSTDSVWILRI